MNERIRITRRGTEIKKYVLSWLLPLLVVTLYIYSGKGVLIHIILITAFLLGVLFSQLNRLEYSKDAFYLDGKEYSFNCLIDLKILEVNIYQYLLFKINDQGKIKLKVVDPGKYGVISIIWSFFYQGSSLKKLENFILYAKDKIKVNSN